MADKEKITMNINGVDVSECEHHRKCILPDNIGCKIDDFLCCDKPNCYFKQLARKTQEYEVLQEQNQKLQMQLCNECGERDDYNIPCKMIRDLDYGLQKEIEENDRYRRALEEIEEYTKKYFCENCEDFNTPEYSSHCEFCEYQEYFDIIHKAKGEKKCQ